MLSKLKLKQDPRLLVGLETSDDAAVYQINETMAMIQTVDFFTPIVDDPFLFGQIAAANALSDIYAMGGEPVLALNLACFPNCLDAEILADILAGGASKVEEAGAQLAGGHTIMDDEPKYGLSVTGFVHPEKIWTNRSAKEGDVLLLTKPIGTGIITTAAKGGLASEEALNAAIKSMLTLQKETCEEMKKFEIHACTDITGFGLLGHAMEIAKASGVTIEFFAEKIPLLPDTELLASMGLIPEGAYRNREYLEQEIQFVNRKESIQDILFSPETSGGLFVALDKKEAILLQDILHKKQNCCVWEIGIVHRKKEGLHRILVSP